MRSTLYCCLGFLFVGIAVVGAVLPLLPSTPFLLLASACFLRSKPELREWLYRSPLFGPALSDWETKRVVRPATKLKALGLLAASGSATLYWSQVSTLACTGLVVALGSAALIVWQLPAERLHPAKRDLPLSGGIPQ